MKITVIVPVYMKPKLAGDIIARILKNRYGEKELIIVIDGETNDEIESAISPYRNLIKVVYNGKQLGKARSLNAVAFSINTDILVFFDNDILLTDDTDFLTNTVHEFGKHDIVEFPKAAVSHSIITGMQGFEFLSYAIATYAFALIANRSPSMNGAAFAIKRDLFVKLNGFSYIVNEDMDLASRAFLHHARFSYNPRLKVYNTLPGTIREWIAQRKRWAVNNVLWLKNNFKHLIRDFFKDARIRLSFAVVFLPMILFTSVYVLLRVLGLTSLLPFIIIIGMHYHLAIGLLLGVVHYHLIFNGLISILLGFFFTGLFHFIFSRILKFKFNPVSFLLFYLFYTPVWLTANIIYGVAVFFNIRINLDWKITSD